jgi:hypothetical protein
MMQSGKSRLRGNGRPIAEVEDYVPQPRFVLVRFCDLRLGKSRRYLVKDWIPREGLVVVWGAPKCGKSFWVFDLMMHVALGWKYRDWRVEAGPVVYVACEGEHGFAARSEAFRQGKISEEGADPPFYLLATRLDLAADAADLIFDIAAQLSGAQCSAVVIDTLNRSLVGSESRDEDMAAYIKGADAIREKFHCAVIIIHHCGIAEARPRGHTSLSGAADAQIAVKRDAADNVVAEVEYMKDGPAGEVTVSRLAPLEVDLDEDGEPITSCVVEPVYGDLHRKPKKILAPTQRRALELLEQAVDIGGEVPPESNHIPKKIRCARESLWREYCYRGGISDASQDAKQKAFRRAARELVAAGLVGKRDPWVWVIRS